MVMIRVTVSVRVRIRVFQRDLRCSRVFLNFMLSFNRVLGCSGTF